MNIYNERINIIMATIGTFFVWLFGAWDLPLMTLVTFMVLDYITGITKAFINKQLSSEYGSKGIVKKSTIFIILIVAVSLDRLLGQGWVFRSIACFWYIGNEGFSILENVIAIGLPVPEELKNALIQLKKGNKKYSEKVGN